MSDTLSYSKVCIIEMRLIGMQNKIMKLLYGPYESNINIIYR